MLPPANPFLPVQKVARPVTFIEAPRLANRLGLEVVIASETFQHTGSFKFRAAYNVAAKVPQQRIITASSGNFGQAMAYASRLLGKSCIVVMPDTSARVKVEAVREHGGTVDLIDVTQTTRQARVAELAKAHPEAYVASAYDDPFVIEGNATLGAELAAANREFEVVLAPVGGGGLTSGLIEGLRQAGELAQTHRSVERSRKIRVTGVEPLLANDTARSLQAGRIIANESEPQTIADGVRTLSVGKRNWAVLREGLAGVVEVSEEQIREAVRLLFSLANLKAEPTGALGIAALLAVPEKFRGHSVCCVVSGGNVDLELYRAILAG
jgi:threonine dehydratase